MFNKNDEGINDKSVKSNIESRKIENLNEKLQFLSKKLAEYLQTLEAKIDKNIELSYAFKLYDILGINSKTKGSIILNFNYTNTINNYIDIYNSYSKYFPFQLINIHGELNSKTNPIVFGYGDESNDEYKIIENLDDNKLMHFFIRVQQTSFVCCSFVCLLDISHWMIILVQINQIDVSVI